MRRRTRQGGATGDSTEQEEGDLEVGLDNQLSDGVGAATTQQEECAEEIVEDVNTEDVGLETEGVDNYEAEAMSEFSLNQPRDQSQDQPQDQPQQEQEEEQSNDEGQKAEADHEQQLPSEEYEDDDVINDAISNDGKGEGHEIEGVVENPLFSPEHCAPQSIEEFTMEAKEEDLDFEPEVDDNETTSSKPEIKEKDCPAWLNNVASPGKVSPEDENNVTIDEIVISDTDDIDEFGDKIDAAYPGTKTGMEEDDESDEEKRGWRSEKSKTVRAGEPTSGTRIGTSPVRRRRRSPVSRLRRRSRSSSIEIVSVRSQFGSPPLVVKRREMLPTGRLLSRSRSRERYRRRSLTPPRRRMTELREERERTERVRRQVEDLRDMVRADDGASSHFGGVKSRLGKSSAPADNKKEKGYKLIVKNFPSSMSDSEFYSMFIRKGELLSCQKKSSVGYVVFKTREGARNAVNSLNGTKNGSLTLSVTESPAEREPSLPARERYRDEAMTAPPPPTGIFQRLLDARPGPWLRDQQNDRFRSVRNREFAGNDRYDPFMRFDGSERRIEEIERFDRSERRIKEIERFERPEKRIEEIGMFDSRERIRQSNYGNEDYDSFMRPETSQRMLDQQDERFHFENIREQGFDNYDNSFVVSNRPRRLTDIDDERFYNEMMHQEMEMSGGHRGMMVGESNYGRMSVSGGLDGYNMTGRGVNTGSMMSGTIRRRMGGMTGFGGEFSGYGGPQMEEDGVRFGEVGYSSMGGQLGEDRSYTRSLTGGMIMERGEVEDPRRGLMMRSNINMTGADRDLRPSASNSSQFVIGGKRSSNEQSHFAQSSSFTEQSSREQDRGAGRRSGAAPNSGSWIGRSYGGGRGQSTWSNRNSSFNCDM